MARCLRVCVFLCFLLNYHRVFGIKEFFCKDPDTEDLHHVNTTWPSTKFCGNYTCKLKKRSINDMENHSTNTNYFISNSPYEHERGYNVDEHPRYEDIATPKQDPNSEVTTKKARHHYETTLSDLLASKVNNDQDRLLNEAEINSITGLLHTIKKSDIDAIIEVYNLAQDIYKEMEMTTMKTEINTPNIIEQKVFELPRHSYWYDPLYHNIATFDKMKDSYKEPVDPVPLQPAIPTILQPALPTLPIQNSFPLARYPVYPNAYALQRQPISGLPFYYPLSVQNIQNPIPVQSNYKTYLPVQEILRTQSPQYNSLQYNNHPCPWSTKILKKQYTFYPQVQKMERVANLLPLPFSYSDNLLTTKLLYNYTDSNPIDYPRYQNYYPRSEVEQIQITTPEPMHLHKVSPPVMLSATQSPNLNQIEMQEKDVIKLKDIRRSTQKLDDINAEPPLQEKQKEFPPWKTPSLSKHILDEVRANILGNTEKLLSPFQLKKKLRLERVLKLDEITRDKREIIEVTRGDILEENDIEVFLEKVTCEMDTDPGLFSLGDLTLPFPACCPQKLNPIEAKTYTSSQPPTTASHNSYNAESSSVSPELSVLTSEPPSQTSSVTSDTLTDIPTFTSETPEILSSTNKSSTSKDESTTKIDPKSTTPELSSVELEVAKFEPKLSLWKPKANKPDLLPAEIELIKSELSSIQSESSTSNSVISLDASKSSMDPYISLNSQNNQDELNSTSISLPIVPNSSNHFK